MSREPNSTVRIYELGIYEQMKIQDALEQIVSHTEDAEYIIEDIDTEMLTELARIFQAHGSVIIIRKEEEQ